MTIFRWLKCSYAFEYDVDWFILVPVRREFKNML